MNKLLRDLEAIQRLRSAGVLSESEFAIEKERILGYSTTSFGETELKHSSTPDGEENSRQTTTEDENDITATEQGADPLSGPYRPNRLPSFLIGFVIFILSGVGVWLFWQPSDAELVSAIATGPANIRDMPTVDGGRVVGVLKAGDLVQGEWVTGSVESKTRWLKITGPSGEQFVWEGNLKIASNANGETGSGDQQAPSTSISPPSYRMEAIGLEKPASGHSVLFILDEFASLGHMEMLEKAAGLMAGYGVKLWPIVQDLTQIKKHYRESWETFLANAGAVTFFANSDLTTLEWLSKRMGETEVIRENKGSSTSETKGTSETNGTSQQEGESWTDSQSQTESDMAPLSQLATVQGGQSIFDVFTRRFEKSTAESHQTGRSEGASSQKSESHSTAESASKTNGRSRSEQIIKTNLMTVDEIAAHFARETGRMVAFVSGKGPYAVNRTPYFADKAFRGLVQSD